MARSPEKSFHGIRFFVVVLLFSLLVMDMGMSFAGVPFGDTMTCCIVKLDIEGYCYECDAPSDVQHLH